MSGELKKSFEKKDVQRLRNLLKGNSNERTTLGVGYDKKYVEYKEGDIWEEDGRKWTIKNGIKQNITKLDKAKKAVNLPLFCPKCSSLMKNKYDKPFYLQHNHCFDCHINFETDLKKRGLWEEYEKNIYNSDLDNLIKHYSSWIDDQINTNPEQYLTESGEVEKWVGGNRKEQLLKEKEDAIKYLTGLKK